MKRKTLLQYNRFFILLLIFTLLASLFGAREAFAYAEVRYTGALEDLRKAENFDPSYYPTKEGDYTVSLIQIAESKDNELFVYTYQPASDERITASSINISRTSELNVTPQNYYLTLLSREGVFCKYVVKDFKVSDEPTRYYAIPSIFRSWVNDIDGDQSGSQTVTEKPFEVAEQFRFGTLNGKEYVERKKIDVITVMSKFVGFVRYTGEYKLGFMNTALTDFDCHFVAFNTDRRIDTLLEADLSYVKQDFSAKSWVEGGTVPHYETTYGERSDQIKVELMCDQSVDHTGSFIYGSSFSFNRIQSVTDFLSSEETSNVYKCGVFETTEKRTLTDDVKAELEDKSWVLRFLETNRTNKTTLGGTEYSSTLVGDVTILRLKFVTDGITYNLGVVDNKQTGGTDPVNIIRRLLGLNPVVTWLLLAVMLFVVLIVLMPFLPTILSFLFKLIVWIVKAVVWLVSLPVRGVAALVRAIKERKEDR